MQIDWKSWHNHSTLHSKPYVCGFCGEKVAPHNGYQNTHNTEAIILLCGHCGCPTFFFEDNQYPGALIGREIDKLPEDIGHIYRELREDYKNSAYTSVVLLGRKLIMHLAVSVDAKEKLSFAAYVDYLNKSGYVPPNGKEWLKYMKKLGNVENHVIRIASSDEAGKIIKFAETLLIFMYEFASEMPSEKEEAESEA